MTALERVPGKVVLAGLPVTQARGQAARAAENFRFFADMTVTLHEDAFNLFTASARRRARRWSRTRACPASRSPARPRPGRRSWRRPRRTSRACPWNWAASRRA